MKLTNPQTLLCSTLSKEEIVDYFNKAPAGRHVFFNMFQEGGAMVTVGCGTYALFEIPLYGGSPRYYDVFTNFELEKMVDVALSWT